MKNSLLIWGLLAATCLASTDLTSDVCAQAKEANKSMLVSTAWLAEHLVDRSLVVLQTGNRASYGAGHIPGARLIEMSMISASGPLTLELPPVDKLKSAFEELGVSDNSRIVICFSGNSITSATRTFFTLDYLGLSKQTSLLDGGLEAWKAEGRSVTTEATVVARGNITQHPRQELVVDAAWVSANLKSPKIAIVDARDPQFYTGANAGRMPRAGHIPTAVNITFSRLANAANKFQDSAALAKIFNDAGVAQGKQVVSYCHIGLQASLVYFVAKYLGYDARLYDGSFEDWSKRTELPVVGPEPKTNQRTTR